MGLNRRRWLCTEHASAHIIEREREREGGREREREREREIGFQYLADCTGKWGDSTSTNNYIVGLCAKTFALIAWDTRHLSC